MSGYKKALKDNEIIINNDYIHNVNVSSVQECLKIMENLDDPPTSFVLGNDFVLKEYLQYMQDMGDIDHKAHSVVVFDQNPHLNYFRQRISSITQPTFDMGKRAAELLLNKISEDEGGQKLKENKLPQKYIFDGKLEIRDNSK